MMASEEAERKYGKEMMKKVKATGLLNGITMTILDNVETDVPDED